MWLLLGIMGALMASSLVDFQPRTANGIAADDDDDAARPEDRWLDNPDDDPFRYGELNPGEDDPGDDDSDTEAPPPDPWLDGWQDDEFISDDETPDDDDEDPGDDTGDDHADDDDDDPDTEAPAPDPWLDGWQDDEFISDDETPDDDNEDPGDDTEEDDADDDDEPDAESPPPDPWLDGWQDDEFISSDTDEAATMAEVSRVVGSGERVLAGAGEVFVLGEWVDAADPIILADFNPAEDRLVYAHVAGESPPDMSLAALPEPGNIGLLVDGQLVARFEGGAPPAIGSVELLPVNIDADPSLMT